MLNVWSVCVGNKYTDEDVLILREMVRRNLSQPHDFWCLSDRQVADVNCLIPPEQWPGWWSKLLLFRYATGQCLYLDLDVVVVRPLDRLVSERLSMPLNWGQSGHGGCQSSVMSWGEDLSHIADSFDPDELGEPVNGNYGYFRSCWGDQEWITRLLGAPGQYIKPMLQVVSYKYHCLHSVPEDAAVVCFHGEPKPGQVHEQWVRQARSFTAIPA